MFTTDYGIFRIQRCNIYYEMYYGFDEKIDSHYLQDDNDCSKKHSDTVDSV